VVDYKTAADLASGTPVPIEKVRDFVIRARWAHEEKNANRNTIQDLRNEIARRDAEIVMLKDMLLECENQGT
jgi:hypothetical protein